VKKSTEAEQSVERYASGTEVVTELPESAEQTRDEQRLFRDGQVKRLQVFARRHLSELRDNHIAKSESLLSLSKRLRNLLTPARRAL
jgi:hypothetical protein